VVNSERSSPNFNQTVGVELSVGNSIADERILVTGGAGFISSQMGESLLNLNCYVAVLDNLSSGKAQNLPEGPNRMSFVLGDIRDSARARRVPARNA